MPDQPSIIVHTDGLTQPVDTFVKKMSKAIGGLAEPWQTTRVAEAQAKADIIRAKASAEVAAIQAKAVLEVQELQQRAADRLVAEETRKQRNMESIATGAVPLLESTAKPDAIDDDFVAHFFDKCRNVSDPEMQTLWSKVIAGEANASGSWSRRTVSFMETMEKSDAKGLELVCSFAIRAPVYLPFIYDLSNVVYVKNGLMRGLLNHLEERGLVRQAPPLGFHQIPIQFRRSSVTYFDETFTLDFARDGANFNTGTVYLTDLGQQIARLCTPRKIEGLTEYLIQEWAKSGVSLVGP